MTALGGLSLATFHVRITPSAAADVQLFGIAAEGRSRSADTAWGVLGYHRANALHREACLARTHLRALVNPAAAGR